MKKFIDWFLYDFRILKLAIPNQPKPVKRVIVITLGSMLFAIAMLKQWLALFGLPIAIPDHADTIFFVRILFSVLVLAVFLTGLLMPYIVWELHNTARDYPDYFNHKNK